MEDKKQDVIKWIKTHKTQLLLVGTSIPTLIALVLGLKNKAAIIKIAGESSRRNQASKSIQQQMACNCFRFRT